MARFKELNREEIDILITAIRQLRSRSYSSRDKNIAGFMQQELMRSRIDADILRDTRSAVHSKARGDLELV